MATQQGQHTAPAATGQLTALHHKVSGLLEDQERDRKGGRQQRLGRRKSTRPAPSLHPAVSKNPDQELGSSLRSWTLVQRGQPAAPPTVNVPRPLSKTQAAIWFLSFVSSLGTSSIATRTLVGSSNSARVGRCKHGTTSNNTQASSQEVVLAASSSGTSGSSMVQLWYQLFSLFSFSSSSPRPPSMSFTDTIPLSETITRTSTGCSAGSSSSSSISSFSWRGSRPRRRPSSLQLDSMQFRALTIVTLLWILCVAPYSAPLVSAYAVDNTLTRSPGATTHGPPAALSNYCNHSPGHTPSHGRNLVKRDESIDDGPVSFGTVSFEARPLSVFTSFAALDEANMACNGRADLCDLRYNQVTYAGTHNSAAYDLKYDCDTAVESCLKSTTYCVQQQQNCTKGWETRCTKMSNTCLDRLPKWLHWLCGAFNSVCESTEQFCLGWEQICTSSVQVCTLWGSACLEVVPQWLLPCLWENQPGHPIAQQLADGIRFLDLGTCLTVDNSSVVMCHGYGAQRAIGVSLDSVLSAVLDFYLKNPHEILTLEFNEADGDATEMSIMSGIIMAKMKQYFTLPNGHSLLWSRKSSTEAWPTLREMIVKNQRIMVFMGSVYDPIPEPKPAWANQKDVWKYDAFRYTYDDTTPAELNATYYKYCSEGPKKDGSFIQWQQIDINMAILADELLAEVKAGKMPQVCLEPLAIQTNSGFLDALAEYCYDKWPYWFRVRVNYYWHGNVFSVTNRFNDLNVARVKAGDTITPY